LEPEPASHSGTCAEETGDITDGLWNFFLLFFERNYGKTFVLPEFYCQKGDTAKYIEILQMVAN
jgi:hypothetical protein